MNVKHHIIAASWLLFPFALVAQSKSSSLDVYVTDHESHLPIAGAKLVVGKKHYHTNDKGFAALPRTALQADSLYITCLGYHRHAVATQQLKTTHPTNIALCHTEEHLSTAIVTEQRRQVSKTVVADRLTERTIEQNLGNSLGATLRAVKGVSTIESGANIAKPVVHGMYGNRILIMNNGARQQGQQWGDDHAPEVDLNSAATVEVVKGAQAVRYGSDALGGIILLEAAPLPYFAHNALAGKVSALYAINGRRFATTAQLEGQLLGLSGWAWRAQGTWLNGGDRSTARYLLNNTAAREGSFSLSVGKRAERWGAEAYYSRYATRSAVMYTAHAANEALLKERISYGQPLELYPFSRHIDYPYQKVVHHLLRLKGHYALSEADKLTAQVSWQSDHRDEFHLRRNDLSSIPSLSLDLYSLQTDLAWRHTAEHWRTETGLFFGSNKNTNLAGTGVVPIIPNYTQLLTGAYATGRYLTERWGAEAGLRADWQEMNSRSYNYLGQRYGGVRRFMNFIYNLGANYRWSPHWTVTTNLGMAWRAPHPYELYSNGLDHASGVYVLGDSTMTSERSTKWITSLAYHRKHFSFSVDAFLQWVDHYSYDEPTGEYMTVISGAYPVFRYRQVRAFFRGVDAELAWEPFSCLRYQAMASMIWANEQRTHRYLPYIPPFRLTQSVTYELPAWRKWQGVYVKATHRFVARQHRFDAATDLISYAPPSYTLLGVELGATLPLGKQRLSFLVQAENLLNKEYKEYTNRYRYYAHDLGRDVRFTVTYQF